MYLTYVIDTVQPEWKIEKILRERYKTLPLIIMGKKTSSIEIGFKNGINWENMYKNFLLTQIHRIVIFKLYLSKQILVFCHQVYCKSIESQHRLEKQFLSFNNNSPNEHMFNGWRKKHLSERTT